MAELEKTVVDTEYNASEIQVLEGCAEAAGYVYRFYQRQRSAPPGI